MSRAYDMLMKSGKFTAAQVKGEDSAEIDSISEIVLRCEQEGFIPKFYIDKPNDSVDRTLQDFQQYTKVLVTEETNLSNMIESSLKEILKDKERESQSNTEDDDIEDPELFDYTENQELEDADYSAYFDQIEVEKELDRQIFNGDDE